MAILQVGLPKSGNLWLYRILENILDAHGVEQRSYIQQQPIYAQAQTWPTNFSGQAGTDVLLIEPDGCFAKVANSQQRYPLVELDDYLHQCRHIWCHSGVCQRTLQIAPKLDKIVYIIRDPRDCGISQAQFNFLPVRLAINPQPTQGYTDPDTYLRHEFGANLRAWVNHVGGYLQYKEQLAMHVVFYERLLYAFDQEVGALLDYLEISLTSVAWAKLKADTAFAAMKAQDEGHVRQGEAGGWRDSLSRAQQRQAAQIAGPLLTLLNYSLDARHPIDTDHLPSLPFDLRPEAVQRAMKTLQPSRLQTVVRRLKRRLYPSLAHLGIVKVVKQFRPH